MARSGSRASVGETGAPRLADICSMLRGTLPGPPDTHVPGGRVAAVAAVLRENAGNVELLFIRRARRRGDPWSGHMAWPGGKREPCDTTNIDCAVRETREEIGLDLARDGRLVGRLRGWESGRPAPRGLHAIFAYVFAVGDDVDLRVGSEVQEIVWIPISYFGQWRRRSPWSWFGRWLPAVPPAFRYDGRLIWGLTQWMLGDLLARVAAWEETTAGRGREQLI